MGFNICTVYRERFKRFPSSGAIDGIYMERVDDIFNQMFNDRVDAIMKRRQFFISDDVVVRAIDLVSGLLQQMKILMDDTNAPIWNGCQIRPVVVLPINNDQPSGKKGRGKKKENNNGKCYSNFDIFIRFLCALVEYVSSEKLEKIAVEILLYPSLCFTATQLRANPMLHNVVAVDLNAVLVHLIKCELMLCIKRGIKSTRNCTCVYVKQLPACDEDGEIDFEQRLSFNEKLNEFTIHHPNLTIDEYLKKNSIIALDAIGVVTNELVKVFSMPEYKKIDISPLYTLKVKGTIFSCFSYHFSYLFLNR